MGEAIPGDMPEPRGNLMSTHIFVDSIHGGNKVTGRSVTGVLLFFCMAPDIMFSKSQNTVGKSRFGSEFTALKNEVELV